MWKRNELPRGTDLSTIRRDPKNPGLKNRLRRFAGGHAVHYNRAMEPTAPPASEDVAHIDTWVFDLDNTLYPASSRLFDQVSERIGTFIADYFSVDRAEARRRQKDYFHKYGTTLRGLMIEHELDPTEFLDFVHDIDLSPIAPNPALDAAIERLPGRKLIFTNADVPYAERVMARLGVAHHFEAIFDIAAANWIPKPFPEAYDILVERHAIDPARAMFAEDILRNLGPAAERGMLTVWVKNSGTWALPGNEDVSPDHVTEDLADWLHALHDAVQPPAER